MDDDRRDHSAVAAHDAIGQLALRLWTGTAAAHRGAATAGVGARAILESRADGDGREDIGIGRTQDHGHFEVRRVSRNSGIRWKKQWVCVTHTLAGEYVGLEEVGDGLWDVYFGPVTLGRMDERPGRFHH